jgi:hypothetical protein
MATLAAQGAATYSSSPMQPNEFDVIVSATVGMLAGGVVVLGIVVGWQRLKKRRREARRERPPQAEKLLRPAGYSALCRLEELADSLVTALFQAIGAGLVFGLMAGAFYPLLEGLALGRFTFAEIRHAPKSETLLAPACLVLIGLLWSIREITVVWKIEDQIRTWRLGMRGEQAVAEALADRTLAAAGYVAFHDVPGDGKWNIDHVVVGPAGVFVLETKARPRRKANRQQQENLVFFDGRVLEFPWCEDRNAVDQVQRNARWVREFLTAFPPKDIPVQPVIVVPGWYVTAKGNYPVKAMPAAYLVGYLKSEKPRFSQEELQPVIQRLDERCRTLEF